MKVSRLLPCLALALLLAATVDASPRNVTDADAPRSLESAGPVSVDWTDPAQFSEVCYSANRRESRRGNWVEQLARHLRETAARQLPAGQTLRVTLTDIRRAGSYEPWHGPDLQDTRVIRDLYPPRITLQFTRLDARGEVLDQGERKLVDPGFLTGSTRIGESDPLRYEKKMLDDWLRREIRPGSDS